MMAPDEAKLLETESSMLVIAPLINTITSRLVARIKDQYLSISKKAPKRFGKDEVGVNTLTDNLRASRLIIDSQAFAVWRGRGGQGSSSQGGGGGHDGSQGGGDCSNSEEEESPPNPDPNLNPNPNPNLNPNLNPNPNPYPNQGEEEGPPRKSPRKVGPPPGQMAEEDSGGESPSADSDEDFDVDALLGKLAGSTPDKPVRLE